MSFIRRAKDNYFVINGRPSTDWGITISCDSAFNGAERDVEAITIPGRDGDLLMDKGRFKNIAVTYNDCLIESDFTAEFDSFRAYISSLRGYVRLEDTFHPEEYRMAYLGEGIKVDRLGTRYHSGVFDVTFTCLPQRFRKSGEEALSIPVAPAQTPATARRYWRLSAFGEYSRSLIEGEMGAVGYTSAEINATQFSVLKISDAMKAKLNAMPHEFSLAEMKGAVTDRFFMILCNNDPLTETGQMSMNMENAVTGWYPDDLDDFSYIITPKAFGLEFIYNGIIVAQDETYQFGTIVNPTRFEASPKLRIQLPANMDGLSGATVYIGGIGQNGVALKWNDRLELLENCIVTIDTELMDVYILPEDCLTDWGMKGTFVNLNPYAKFYGQRIKLIPGENTIRLDPMITGCEIVPRWWTI